MPTTSGVREVPGGQHDQAAVLYIQSMPTHTPLSSRRMPFKGGWPDAVPLCMPVRLPHRSRNWTCWSGRWETPRTTPHRERPLTESFSSKRRDSTHIHWQVVHSRRHLNVHCGTGHMQVKGRLVALSAIGCRRAIASPASPTTEAVRAAPPRQRQQDLPRWRRG